MNWTEILAQLFELVLFPLITIGGIYLIALIKAKLQAFKLEKNNDLYTKYLTMLEITITDCVLATTQTYVDSLKKQGKFDADAQKIAFQKTYDNVMTILTEDAKAYLTNAVGDLQAYVQNKIEAEVLNNK